MVRRASIKEMKFIKDESVKEGVDLIQAGKELEGIQDEQRHWGVRQLEDSTLYEQNIG